MANSQPAIASFADYASSTAPEWGINFRHRRTKHPHKSAFAFTRNKQLDIFNEGYGDEDDIARAQDLVGNASGNAIPDQQHSPISMSTQEPAVSPSSEHQSPTTAPRLPLGDLTNVNLDGKATCSSTPSHTGTTWKVPGENFTTKFAVPLIPLRNTAFTKGGLRGSEDSASSGNYTTADSTTNQFCGEVDHMLAEQKRHDLDRLRAQLAALPSKPKPRRLELKNLAAYMKKTGYSQGPRKLPDPKSAPAQVETFPSGTSDVPRNDRDTKGVSPNLHSNLSQSFNADLGQRLKVRCLSATLNLPIAGDTTTNDIRSAAASIIPHDADLNTSVVVECIVAQGLERDLRGYENVRELMDSWAPCDENFLRVDQRAASALGQEPTGIALAEGPVVNSSFLLQHASYLKKWNERWVTLREDGQLFAIDRKNYSPDNAEELCHLSTFDIYTVSMRGFKHRRNAPGPFRYALKSQEKAGLSQETIHFFCTADAAHADRFFRLVHCWRSRYLLQRKTDIRGRQFTLEEYGAMGQSVGFSTSATPSKGMSIGPGSLSASSEESSDSMSRTEESRDNDPSFPASVVSVTGKPGKLQDGVSGPVFGCCLELDKSQNSPITPWPVICGSPADYFGSNSPLSTADATCRGTAHEFL